MMQSQDDAGPALRPVPGELGGWQRLLLSLSGRCPDDVLVEARRRLSGSRLTEAAELVAYSTAALEVALTPEQAALLRPRLPTAAAEQWLADLILLDEDEIVLPPWPFAPDPPRRGVVRTGPAARPQDRTPGGLDGDLAPGVMAELDGVLVRAATTVPALTGVWRAVRQPVVGLVGALPVVLASVAPGTPDDDLPAVADRLARAAGDLAGSVEVCPAGDPPPPYQQAAMHAGALIWSRSPGVVVRVAPLPDVAPTAPSGPRIDPDAAAELVDVLMSATVVLIDEVVDDPLDPAAGPVVPLTVRTDGVWVWSDAVAYYLEVHGTLPDAGLVAHLRTPRPRGAVDDVARHRALVALAAEAARDRRHRTTPASP